MPLRLSASPTKQMPANQRHKLLVILPPEAV